MSEYEVHPLESNDEMFIGGQQLFWCLTQNGLDYHVYHANAPSSHVSVSGGSCLSPPSGESRNDRKRKSLQKCVRVFEPLEHFSDSGNTHPMSCSCSTADYDQTLSSQLFLNGVEACFGYK